MSGRKDRLMESVMQNGNISYSKIPADLAERDFQPEKHGSGKVILDENVIDDVKHGVIREYEDSAEMFAALPLVSEMYGPGEVYVEHEILDDIHSESYEGVSMLSEEVLGQVAGFFRQYTKDLALDEWRELLDQSGDDLYREIAEYQDSVLLTYDRDFYRDENAMTPGNYLDGWRDSLRSRNP